MTTRRLSLTAFAALAALTLAACSSGSGATPSPDDGATMTSDSTATSEPTEEASDADGTPDAVALPECDGFLLETGAQVTGTNLSACMSAAMFAAGTGSQIARSDTGTTHVDFQWTPEFSMSVTGDSNIVIRGDDGWVQMDGGWVHGDVNSSDPQEMLAGSILELATAFGDPRGMTHMFTQTSWTVVEQGSVPVTDAVADTAWLLQPDTDMEYFGVTSTDVQLWLRSDYLGVYFIATGSMAGITATSSNTFTQWGGDVEIPDVAG